MEDDAEYIYDSKGIMIYLNAKYANNAFIPADPVSQSRVAFWLSFVANEVQYSLCRARSVKLFEAPYDYDVLVESSYNYLNFLNSKLSKSDWLMGDTITIADLAVFPYVMLTKDTTIKLNKYPKVKAWVDRIELQDWYIPMPDK